MTSKPVTSASREAQSPTFVDAEFSARLEQAEIAPTLEHIAHLNRLTAPDAPLEERAEAFELCGGCVLFGRRNSPMNHWIGGGLQHEVYDADLERVEHFYRERRNFCEIVVSPLAHPSLVQKLGERGYRLSEWNQVYFQPLTAEHAFDSPLPANVTLRRLTNDPDEGLRWAELLARGFAEYNTPEFQIPASLFAPWASAPNQLCFTAFVNGEPAGAAAGMAIPQHRLAALFGAATLPEFRGNGVQTALIRARLKEAFTVGCELAVVVTQPGTASERNAVRAGFRLAYTKAAFQKHFE